MVLEALVLLLVLAGLTAAFTLLAERITIPDPVLLAAVGILLSFVRVFPSIKLNPELVLLAMLPPLVYSSAVELSWEEFRGNARPISLFAVGLVAVTST